MYDSLDLESGYARMRIEGTIVRDKKGAPFYVRRVGMGLLGGIECTGTYLKDFYSDDLKLQEKDLNLQSFHIGYVNFNNSPCSYINRIPKRADWRQGIRSENTCSTNGKLLFEMDLKEIHKAIVGDYPSFKEACQSGKETAFCKTFSTDGSKLFYRGNIVGTIEGTKPVLNEGKEYLYESLLEAVDENSA